MIFSLNNGWLSMDDVVIIGGSSAGLSAALVLGRALRRVVVLDDAKPCNRFSHASHGFLTQDGTAPADLVAAARAQVERYDSVTFVRATATAVETVADGFRVSASDGQVISARKLLLATGLRDELPPIEGIEALWGRSVIHCPYCDGYEVHSQPIVIYADHEHSFHQALMVSQWTGDLTVCTAEGLSVPDDWRAKLDRRGVRIVESAVVGFNAPEGQLQGVMLADGREIACRAVFVRPVVHHRTPFAHDLGCKLGGHGLVEVDVLGRTSVPGVYAAGDLSNPLRSVAQAVAQGGAAAAGINFDLIMALDG